MTAARAPVKRLILILIAAVAFIAAGAQAEQLRHGHFRVALNAELTPKRLPRNGSAPVQFKLRARFIPDRGQSPPQLQGIRIEVNRHGRIDPGAFPYCSYERIQPATSAEALAACRSALVGEGHFAADVKFTAQTPFPSDGKLLAFNGTWKGRPAVLAHIYGSKPIPTSNTIPFVISAIAKGTYGTALSTSLPQFAGEWGYVTELSMALGRTRGGGRNAYLTAGCPAPRGLPIVGFPLSRTAFGFTHHQVVSQTLVRTCKPRS